MNRSTTRPPSTLKRWLAPMLAGIVASAALAPAAQASYVLAPQYAGTFATGEGANASFHRIANDWQGSAVLWDEPSRRYGSGVPIGTFVWGTGLWGQVDWLAVQQAAAGQPSAASGAIVQSFGGVLPTINHGNARYNECYSATWGPAALVPLFSAPSPPLGDCNNAEAGDPAQQNWTARYSGFIRITDPGEYNFSVLHDDGFFFRLIGAGAAELDIGRDYLNPRDRLGYDQSLQLSAGLYGFELGAWNRLGAGVVDLSWAAGGCTGAACNWQRVPTENLLSAHQVPEPSTLSAALAALAALGALSLRASRRRKLPPSSLPGLRSSRCARAGG